MSNINKLIEVMECVLNLDLEEEDKGEFSWTGSYLFNIGMVNFRTWRNIIRTVPGLDTSPESTIFWDNTYNFKRKKETKKYIQRDFNEELILKFEEAILKNV